MRIEFSGRAVELADEPDGRRRMARIGWAVEEGGSCSEAVRGNTGDLGGLRDGVVLLCRRGEEGRRPRFGMGGVVALALSGESMGLGYCAKSLFGRRERCRVLTYGGRR